MNLPDCSLRALLFVVACHGVLALPLPAAAAPAPSATPPAQGEATQDASGNAESRSDFPFRYVGLSDQDAGNILAYVEHDGELYEASTGTVLAGHYRFDRIAAGYLDVTDLDTGQVAKISRHLESEDLVTPASADPPSGTEPAIEGLSPEQVQAGMETPADAAAMAMPQSGAGAVMVADQQSARGSSAAGAASTAVSPPAAGSPAGSPQANAVQGGTTAAVAMPALPADPAPVEMPSMPHSGPVSMPASSDPEGRLMPATPTQGATMPTPMPIPMPATPIPAKP